MNSRQRAVSLRERLRPPPVGAALIDAVLVIVCLTLTALAVKTPWASTPWPVIVLAGSVGSLALAVRRRYPVAVTAAGAVAMIFSGNPGPLIIALFSGAVDGPRRAYPALAATGVLGFVLPDLVSDHRLDGATITAGLAATAVLMAAGLFVTTRRQLVASLRDRAERVEAERALRDERARAGERNRIAREMHDVLAHKIALISLHAGGLEVNPTAAPNRIEQAAHLIRTTAAEALDELRGVLGVLRGSTLPEAGEPGLADDDALVPDGPDTFADLRRLVDRWTAASPGPSAVPNREAGAASNGRAGSWAGGRVRSSRCGRGQVTLHDRVGALPPVTARTVYRLAQEGLTNAHRHAPGAPVTIEITGAPGREVVVAVVNQPGRSVPPAETGGAGVGLVGLAERFRLVGGTVSSGPDSLGGWRLEGRLAWPGGGPQSQDGGSQLPSQPQDAPEGA